MFIELKLLELRVKVIVLDNFIFLFFDVDLVDIVVMKVFF